MNKILKVHVEYDVVRDFNSWVISDSEELIELYCNELIQAHRAVEDWMPGTGAKMVLVTDIMPANLYRNIALINPTNITKSDLKDIPPILCVNDEVFELCGEKPHVFGVKILKSIANLNFLHKCADTNFHLIGLLDR